jgi:hypothetical protein
MADVNQGIVNYGSIGGNASVHIVQHDVDLSPAAQKLAAAPLDPLLVTQLQALVTEMQAALRATPRGEAAAAKAVASAVTATVDSVSAGKAPGVQPDKKRIELSAKGMLEAAEGLAGVLPVALKIAAALGTAFGLGL